MNQHAPFETFSVDVMAAIERSDLPAIRKRDMRSAASRICEMIGISPQAVPADVKYLRQRLKQVLPVAHGVSKKTFANQKSLFLAVLELAGIIDPVPRGVAREDFHWGPLLAAIAHDKRRVCGIVGFANWCVLNNIAPEEICDDHILDFLGWLETRTLCPRPQDVVRRVPNIWNEVAREVPVWPGLQLSPLSFRVPSEHLSWEDLSRDFRRDAEAYLAARKSPDVFDERPNAPQRRLADSTIEQQRAHLRLAASVLAGAGAPVEDIKSLADLVEADAYKTILRHYHDKADGQPNAFVVGLAKTLQQVAKYHVGQSDEQLNRLKNIAGKLPAVPCDITEKNMALMRRFDSETTRAKLFYLPEDLQHEVQSNLDKIDLVFVDAQIAIAVDIALGAPLRPQNLSALNWRRHFQQPNGPRGRLMLHIPADETKTEQRPLTFLIPDETAERIRWYRREILPRLGADPGGDLFVNSSGVLKDQKTFASQIIGRMEAHVGVHMTPHQFRHLAAKFYLERHPEDFRTVTDLLGHSSAKTALYYAGLSNERASKVYTSHIAEQRDALKLKRRRRRKRKA